MIEERTDTSASVNMQLPCVYNPTPIAELKKRHIPIVSYMPTRKSKVAVKRKCSPDGVKPWLNIGNESMESQNVEIKYKPTMIISPESRDTMQSYIPTCKSDSASLNSCKDGSSNEYLFKLRETYYPKCKKRREEYVPKKVKAPLKSVDGLNESAFDHFETELDMMDEVTKFTKSSIKSISDVQSDKMSQDNKSSINIEPKFSDDDEEENNHDNVENHSHNDTNKTNIAQIDSIDTEQIDSYRDTEKSDYLKNNQKIDAHYSKSINDNNCINENTYSNILNRDRFPSKENSKNSLQSDKGNVSEVDSNKDTFLNDKEYKSRDKNKIENQKDHNTSRKDKYESNKKTHSTSCSKSKSKNHLRHKSKGSRDKKYDKDKNKYKHQDKDKNKESKHKTKSDRRDHHRSEKKRHGYSSEKKEEHVKNKNDKNYKHSKIDRKSNDMIIEKFHVHERNKEEINSTHKSVNLVENVRLNSLNNSDEENEDRQSSIIDNDIDVTFSTSDSDHDVQEECLKIFQVCTLKIDLIEIL